MKTSVAMCTYNGAQYIKEQLESIHQQTLLPDEIVICDDGSTDETLQLINGFALESEIPLKVYKNQQQLGVLKNFQQALKLSKGDIIFLCDQDDIWLDKKVRTIVNYFNENSKQEVIFSDALIMRNDNPTTETLWNLINFIGKTKKVTNDNLGMLKRFTIKQNVATGATMAIRKTFSTEILPLLDTQYFMHDGLIAAHAATKSVLGRIDTPLMYYRLHDRQTVGIDKNSSNEVRFLDIATKAKARNWTSNMATVDLMKAFLNDILKKTNTHTPEKHICFLNDVLAHYLRREEILKSNAPRAFLLALKELIRSDGYSLSSEKFTQKIKTILKDVVTH